MPQSKVPAPGSKKPAPKSIMRVELNKTLGEKVLREAAKNLRDRPKILSTVDRFAVKWEKEVFASSGAATGKAWKPLAESTPGRPLVRTGALKRALTSGATLRKASVQLKGPKYGKALAAGRYAPNSRPTQGKKYKDAKKWGGSMPRRNPAPRPPKERIQILTAELLAGVEPK